MSAVDIIEDNFLLRKLFGAILLSEGHSVRGHSSAQGFLDLIASGAECDCLIADLHMPGVSGFELVPQLRKMGLSIPVIFVTGDVSVENMLTAMKQGAFDLLFKPCSADSLLDTVAAALSRTSSEEAGQAGAAWPHALPDLTREEEEAVAHILQSRLRSDPARVFFRGLRAALASAADAMTNSGALKLPAHVNVSP